MNRKFLIIAIIIIIIITGIVLLINKDTNNSNQKTNINIDKSINIISNNENVDNNIANKENNSIIETNNTNTTNSNNNIGESEMKIRIKVGDKILHATFEDNSTTRALKDRMPLTINMMNLYGREMCYRFGNGTLPVQNAVDKGYEIGDISYWPPAGSLVILYKQNGEIFEQQYLGHIDEDVSFFNGMEETDITFELDE